MTSPSADPAGIVAVATEEDVPVPVLLDRKFAAMLTLPR
jgi:hypothetical protein